MSHAKPQQRGIEIFGGNTSFSFSQLIQSPNSRYFVVLLLLFGAFVSQSRNALDS